MLQLILAFLRDNPIVVWFVVGAGLAIVMLTLALLG